MMRDALHFFRSRLGGADVHAFVNLHGIAGNHFAINFFCQGHGQGGFAGGSGPGNTDNIVHGAKPPKNWSGALELLFQLLFA